MFVSEARAASLHRRASRVLRLEPIRRVAQEFLTTAATARGRGLQGCSIPWRLASRFVGISRFETLLDDGEVFILGQRSVLIRIGGGKFLGAQSASQFAPVERSGSLERHVRGCGGCATASEC
jgi:hypothetical protein